MYGAGRQQLSCCESGKSILRRLQWQAALGGNITMQIWLGKQLLGQSDRQSAELTGDGDGPLPPPAVIYLPRGEGGGPAKLGSDAIARKLLPELFDNKASDAPRH